MPEDKKMKKEAIINELESRGVIFEELEKEIGDKLMDVLSRDTGCVKLDKLSEDLSDLLKRPIDVDMDYVKKGTFGNDNIRLLVFSRDDGRKKLASFLLKAYNFLFASI